MFKKPTTSKHKTLHRGNSKICPNTITNIKPNKEAWWRTINAPQKSEHQVSNIHNNFSKHVNRKKGVQILWHWLLHENVYMDYVGLLSINALWRLLDWHVAKVKCRQCAGADLCFCFWFKHFPDLILSFHSQQFLFLPPFGGHNQHVCVLRPRCKAKPALTPDS